MWLFIAPVATNLFLVYVGSATPLMQASVQQAGTQHKGKAHRLLHQADPDLTGLSARTYPAAFCPMVWRLSFAGLAVR